MNQFGNIVIRIIDPLFEVTCLILKWAGHLFMNNIFVFLGAMTAVVVALNWDEIRGVK